MLPSRGWREGRGTGALAAAVARAAAGEEEPAPGRLGCCVESLTTVNTKNFSDQPGTIPHSCCHTQTCSVPNLFEGPNLVLNDNPHFQKANRGPAEEAAKGESAPPSHSPANFAFGPHRGRD